jgi:GT2 family glycosyltransferase
MTIDCLQSLLATDWPADRLDIVMVDNGSVDDVVARVRVELPSVRIVEPLANTGFAGGCNLGIRAPGPFDLVALVNNDATVAPDWLRPLVDALAADARIGAACPKIVFEGRYVEAELEVPDAAKIGIDPRTLGVRLTAARIDGERADDRLAYDEGFFNAEGPDREAGEEFARWSWARGRVRVRAVDGNVPARLSLRVVAPEARDVRLRTHADEATVRVGGGEPAWVDVELEADPFDVINNVGSNLYPNGFGGDRGFLERDSGQYEEPADVFAWCGGAVVLTKAYLDDVGLFDDRLFLYYEDTDLSWRGRLRGWRYVYVPSSLVRHRHAASSGVGSMVFRYYTERNRPLMLVKNAPAGLALREGAGMVKRALVWCGRDLVLRPLTLRMPVRTEAVHQWRLLRGYVRLVPAMLRARWTSGRVVGRASLMSWTQTKETAR